MAEDEKPVILFQCAEDALAKALEQAYARLYHLSDQMRGPCPLCDESDQRCQCWEDDA